MSFPLDWITDQARSFDPNPERSSERCAVSIRMTRTYSFALLGTLRHCYIDQREWQAMRSEELASREAGELWRRELARARLKCSGRGEDEEDGGSSERSKQATRHFRPHRP